MDFIDITKYCNIAPSPDGRYPDCWYWTRSKNDKGYGQLNLRNKIYKVHRISMYLFRDFDLNDPLEICHECDNRLCFNPEHLFIGTHKENMEDAFKKETIIRDKKGRFGDKGYKQILSNEAIKLIFEMIDLKISQIEIAKCLGVSRKTIQNTLKNR